PREYRARHAAEIAHAMQACVERQRLTGEPPTATIPPLPRHARATAIAAPPIPPILLITGDAIATSILVRRDARLRQRHRHAGRATTLPPRSWRTGDPLMQSLLYDVRYACRLLRRAPLFSALVIPTFAVA